MSERRLIRQGDVLLVPITDVPEDAIEVGRARGRVVLAYGEVTGHAHTITHPDVRLVSAEQADELRMWLTVTAPEPVWLEHDEHDALAIPPGVYEVRRQQEYSPAEIRRVTD